MEDITRKRKLLSILSHGTICIFGPTFVFIGLPTLFMFVFRVTLIPIPLQTAVLILAGSIALSISVPVAILLVSDDPVVRDNAKESLNFYINLSIATLLFSLLVFVLIGIPLLIILTIASFIVPLIAIAQIWRNPDRAYRYPFIVRIL
jgi:hypothetical protein